ncbi:MAG: redoxin domain-containing protein [Chloroflexi bacterium]|nr:redoxin domain-containing protein [Chloroflexota bacterium]
MQGYDTFKELNAEVVAVSADSLEAHQRFAQKLGGVPFPLASDANLRVARLYGVADEGAKRATRAVFVIDKGGVILHANRQYSPGNQGHYLEMFKALGMEQ